MERSEDKKTTAEYMATAMLLGMVYDDTINVYNKFPPDTNVFPWECLDADTLRPIGMEEETKRMSDYLNQTGMRS